jgi:tetratricopeptide (TPR) repeat protein
MASSTHIRTSRRPTAVGMLLAAALIVAVSHLVTLLPGATPTARVTAGPERAPVTERAPLDPVPLDPAPLDAGLPAAGSIAQIDHSIDAWSKNFAANPHDYLSATNLAVLYHGRGRLSYDLADHQRALAAARTALSIASGYAPARALEASIQFTLHDFVGADSTADALVRDDPTQLGALATRFDAELELGRLDAARADLDRLIPAGGGGVLIRQARLASVTGNARGALGLAERARSTAVTDGADDGPFYAYAVGEYARLAGDPAVARAAYVDAIAINPGDVAALVGLARIDAFDGRIEAAIAGLRHATSIAPQPEPMALLGDLLTTTGDRTGAATAYETVRFIERLGDIQATTFDRQLLRFELDHGGASEALLARARASLAARPDWTGHDTVAWALYRLGRPAEAGDEIAAARALGADDARLRLHDGAIRLANGDPAGGLAMLRSALDLGPALDPLERAEAMRLAPR